MLPNDVLLPMVLTSGLLDGVNPCAFAVMGFLLAFLFAVGQARLQVLRVGAAYIVGMYLTYFAIGLGILAALASLGAPHVVARALRVYRRSILMVPIVEAAPADALIPINAGEGRR